MIEINNVSVLFKKKVKTNPLRNFFFPKYKSFFALKNINLEIKKGEIFALLGPNGSGKTTLMKLLVDLIQPTSGNIFIDKKKPKKQKIRIGLMLGNSMIYYRMTGYDNLKYFAKIYNINNYQKRINELTKFLGIKDWLYEYVEHYSLGMKSKLALARAMIHNPDILLLDEPTLGLDPNISIEVREKIKQMKKTIIFCTHYLEEAEEIADRIGIIKEGKIIAVDNFKKLKLLSKSKNSSSLRDVFRKLTQ